MKLSKLVAILGISIGQFCNAYGDVDTNKYDACFNTAEQYYQVPKEILKAIAFVESHYNPNAYNENSNGTYDIGLMQINSSWLPKLSALGITEQMLYEPCQSIYMGAWVLANNIKTYGLNWTAVQRYNGNDVDLKYATKVYNRIQETYPSLLSPSQAKLIPMNMKAASNPVTNPTPNHPAQITKNIESTVIESNPESQLKRVETKQQYTNEIDNILRISGVKYLPKNPQNISTNLSRNNQNSIRESGNNLKNDLVINKKNQTDLVANSVKKLTNIESKSALIYSQKIVESYHNLVKESQHILVKTVSVNSKSLPDFKQDYLDNLVMNYSLDCYRNGYWFCSFTLLNSTQVGLRFIAQSIKLNLTPSPVFIQKSTHKYYRKSRKNTSTMLVI